VTVRVAWQIWSGMFIGDFHLVNGRIGSSIYEDFCRGIKVLTASKISCFLLYSLGDMDFSILVHGLLGRFRSAVLCDVLRDLRGSTKLLFDYQIFSLFSEVSKYIFIWYLTCCIKIDTKKRSTTALL
jgi:hypothetical protein